MAYFKTDEGKSVHYEHYSGTGTPVVLIHGWGMSSAVWWSQIDGLLRAGHEVLTVDHRGCGQSDKDFNDLSISAIARDVVDIVKSLKLRPAVINGWSMGTAVAAEVAAALGTSAAGLILTCSISPRLTRNDEFPYGGEPGSYQGLGDGIFPDRAAFFAGLSQGVFARDVSKPLTDWLTAIFLQSGPRAYQSLAGAETLDQRALLRGLTIPVLAVVGGKDAVVDSGIGRAAAELAPKGEVHEFPECGHGPFLEEPQAYLDVILRFVARCG